jgi:hypothetical protein
MHCQGSVSVVVIGADQTQSDHPADHADSRRQNDHGHGAAAPVLTLTFSKQKDESYEKGRSRNDEQGDAFGPHLKYLDAALVAAAAQGSTVRERRWLLGAARARTTAARLPRTLGWTRTPIRLHGQRVTRSGQISVGDRAQSMQSADSRVREVVARDGEAATEPVRFRSWPGWRANRATPAAGRTHAEAMSCDGMWTRPARPRRPGPEKNQRGYGLWQRPAWRFLTTL